MSNTDTTSLDTLAASAAAELSDTGVVAIDFQPGNGSRYFVVITDLARVGVAGADPNANAASQAGNRFLVSLPDFGTTYPFILSSEYVGYVADKLFGGNTADAQPVTDLLNAIGAVL